MFRIRVANHIDVPAIREIFLASYGTDYSPRFYDESYLTKLLERGHNLVLIAESAETGQALGTAAVDFEGEHGSNLVGHFGRMAVHPAARQNGAATSLMKELICRVQERIQIGLAEARGAQVHASRVAENHQFAVVGFLPMKMRLREPESFVLLVRHFGNTLGLRRSCPRVASAVYPLAQLALQNCGLAMDALRDEDASTCAPDYRPRRFAAQRLSAAEYTAVFEGNKDRLSRAVVGCVPKMVSLQLAPGMDSKQKAFSRMKHGTFNALTTDRIYLAAREGAGVAGLLEFSVNLHHCSVTVLNVTATDSAGDEVLGFLLGEAERGWTDELGGPARVVEINVNADESRIQTLLSKLGFMPVAYIPALAMVGMQRLDVVKMSRVAGPVCVCTDELSPQSKVLAELVLAAFRNVQPNTSHISEITGKMDFSCRKSRAAERA